MYRTIRQRRGEFERELSPQWRGVAAGKLGAGAAGAALGARPWPPRELPPRCIITFTFLLANVSDVAFAELFALPPRGQITVPRQAMPPTACCSTGATAGSIGSAGG